MDKNNNYKELIHKNIQGQFDSFSAQFEKVFGRAIPLALEVEDLGNPEHYAHFNPARGAVVFNLAHQMKTEEALTIAHEVAHWLCAALDEDWEIAQGHLHTFDFGVLCALLTCRMGVRTKNFFKSYDFHEDDLYPYLSVNPFQFDQLITSTPVRSLEELTAATHRIANNMRHRAWLVKNDLHIAWGSAQ
jgi:hypothetical protein